MNEFEQALALANKVLDFSLEHPSAFYVHGDPDCDAAVIARQFIRLANPAPTKLFAETKTKRCCSAASPCNHQKRFPGTICETCHDACSLKERKGTTMTMSGARPKSGVSFPHDEIPWPQEPRFIERRHGLGWRVFENGDDGVTRWTYTGTFWRWISAARVAQALALAFNNGHHSNSECWQRNRVV